MARQLGLASVELQGRVASIWLGQLQGSRRRLCRRPGAGAATPALSAPTLCCATDGNHGRAVAFGAQRHGCRCVIFVHEHALESKIAPMRALGAEVIRVAGNYDDSVDYAKRMSLDQGWTLISDTSDDAADPVAAQVMQGYGIMILEAAGQLNGRIPTHVFVQAGVGGLAAAVAGCFADMIGAGRPAVIVVEPESAACVMAGALNQGPIRIAGNLSTSMAMLSCGEVSAPAWVILKNRADAFMTVSDEAAGRSAAAAAKTNDVPGGLALTSSAAAGLAGAMAAVADPVIASQLDLTRHSRVLFFATEGVEPR